MKYIAWYTKKSIYEDLFHSHLEPTLIEYGLDYEGIAMPNYSKWNYNVAQKPTVVKEVLLHEQEPFRISIEPRVTIELIDFNQS